MSAADSPAGLALRELQKLDEIASLGDARVHLTAAQGHLGKLLGLTCTGDAEGKHFYGHDGGTCPIHEWLVPADQHEVQHSFYGVPHRW
jgi:hypothetical protein